MTILPNIPEILTVAEVAHELRRSSTHVYTLINAHELRAIRLTSPKRTKSTRESYVVLAADLRDFIQIRRGEVTA